MEAAKADKAELDKTNQVVGNNTANITANTNAITVTNDRLTTEVGRLDQSKADITYVDTRNAEQDAAFLADQLRQDKILAAKVDSSRFDTFIGNQNTVDVAQNKAINQNREDLKNLGYRVDSVERNLSSGIAGTAAIAFMPSAHRAGTRMFTSGVANFNGENALSLGITGINEAGDISYKIGGSYATGGDAVVGGGLAIAF